MRKSVRVAVATAALSVGTAFLTGATGASMAFAAAEKCPNPGGHYPPGQCSKALSVSAQSLAPGQQEYIHGDGFAPNSSARLDLHSKPFQLATFTANASGVVVGSARIPSSAALGSHTLTLTGVDPQGRTLVESASIALTSPASSGRAGNSGSLAFSGANDVAPLTGAGVGMVLAGGLTLLVIRRRRSPARVAT